MAADAAPAWRGTRSAEAPDGPAGLWPRVARLGSAGRSVGGLTLAVLIVLLLVWGPDARLRGLWFDFCQRAAPRVRISGPAVIVAVDEPSLARYGQWPWPRQLLAQLVDRVRAAGPAAVGLNLLFPEADGFSGASLATRLPGLSARTAAWVAVGARWRPRARRGPRRRAERDRRWPGSTPPAAKVAARPLHARGRSRRGSVRAGPALPGGPPQRARHRRRRRRSRPPERDVAGGRRAPAPARRARSGTRWSPDSPSRCFGSPRGRRRSPSGAMAAACARWASGNVWIPAETDGTMWIHFTPHDAARFVSAASVLGGEVPPERLERKLVLVGVTALGLGDQHVTPLGERLPGIEVHAQAAREHLRRPGPRPPALGGVGRGRGAPRGRRPGRPPHPDGRDAPRRAPGSRPRRRAPRRELPRVPASRARARRPHAGARAGDGLHRHARRRAGRGRSSAPGAPPAAPGGARGRRPARGRARGGAPHPARSPAPTGERVPGRGPLPHCGRDGAGARRGRRPLRLLPPRRRPAPVPGRRRLGKGPPRQPVHGGHEGLLPEHLDPPRRPSWPGRCATPTRRWAATTRRRSS